MSRRICLIGCMIVLALVCHALAESEERKVGNAGKDRAGRAKSLFIIKQNGRLGYIDKSGKIVIRPQFGDAWSFSEEMAVVRIGGSWEGKQFIVTGGKWGYIDKTGTMVIKPQFDWAWPFTEGLARITVGDMVSGKVGYIDKAGKWVWKPSE